jgi:hypothetical protein
MVLVGSCLAVSGAPTAGPNACSVMPPHHPFTRPLSFSYFLCTRWLAYKIITPNVIDIWEAWLTLAFFPMFVYTTWLVDTRGFNWFGRHKNAIVHCEEAVEGDAENGGEVRPFSLKDPFTRVLS